MGWKPVVGLSASVIVLALIAYGLFFAEPRWIDIRIERVGSVVLG